MSKAKYSSNNNNNKSSEQINNQSLNTLNNNFSKVFSLHLLLSSFTFKIKTTNVLALSWPELSFVINFLFLNLQINADEFSDDELK